MSQIYNSGFATDAYGLPQPRRQQPTAGSMLMGQAGDTSQPVYGSGHGMAKLLAGALGGVADGYEETQRRQQLARAVAGGDAATGSVFGQPAVNPVPAPAPGPFDFSGGFSPQPQEPAGIYGLGSLFNLFPGG